MAGGFGVSAVVVVMRPPSNASPVSTMGCCSSGGSDKGGEGDDVVGDGSNPLTILLIF